MGLFSFMLCEVKQFDKVCTINFAESPVTVHKLFQEKTIHKGKRQRTRSALLDSAISVVARKGFPATKITDITNHAGLANGTFYNHFEDKDELMREVAVGLAIEITQRIDAEMASIENAATRVIVATAKFLEIAGHEPEWAQVLLSGSDAIPEIHSGLVKFLRKDLELGVNQGHFVIPIDLLLINQIIAINKVAMVLADEEIISKTCACVMRILGISAAKADKLVAKALQKHTHLVL